MIPAPDKPSTQVVVALHATCCQSCDTGRSLSLESQAACVSVITITGQKTERKISTY
jgi:hypothetical protein